MKICRSLALLLVLLFIGLPALAQKTAPPAPLTGTVALQTWVSYDESFAGITLTSGKPFHFNVLPPAQYNSTAYKYPLMIWLAPDMSTNPWYTGANTNPLFYIPNEPTNFNTAAFLTAYPGFVAVPYADQTCSGGDAVCNWGGWTNNGTTGSGTNFSGDTGPNTFAILDMINYLESIDSIDPNRIYCQGFSLGGIGCEYLMQMYNAYNGNPKVFAAASTTGGVLEINGFGVGPTTANATTMANVPVWWFSGANDTTSIPADWNLPMWRDLANNSSYPAAITSPAANQAGTSQMHFTLCGTCGHQETDSAGNPVYTNTTIMNWMFGTASSVVATGTGQFTVSNGHIFDPNGKLYIPIGINIDQNESTYAVTNTAGQPLTTLFPGINHIRLRTNSTANPLQSNATYPDPTTFDAIVNAVTPLGIVVEIEDHSCNGGYIESPTAGVTSTICAVPQQGTAAFTPMATWWAAMATHFKSNPYVWFGSLNEPCSDSACDYGSAVGLVSNYQQGIFNAIRGTGSNAMIQMLAGLGGGNCQTVGAGNGFVAADYATMNNIIWELHAYNNDGATPGNNSQIAGSVAAGCGYLAAQTIQSADGVVPVIFGEWGSGDGSPTNGDASQISAAMITAGQAGYGSTGWAWYPSTQWQMVNNGDGGGTLSLTTWGTQEANVIAQVAPYSGTGGGTTSETLSVNTLSTIAANTGFVVTGSVANATVAPTLQYQNNAGGWTALPTGASVSTVGFTFTDPGMAAPGVGNNTVSVRDANTTTIVATSNSFTVTGAESANDSTVTAALTAASFSDNFTSLSLHNTWQAGDNWQLVSPDTPAGRGGPTFGENGDQWWVNPFNTNTPISGIYVQNTSGLHLGLLTTPAADQAYITAQAGSALPYVAGLLNTSQTNYQKYGYWQITAAVPKVNGFTFQADTENVQLTGTFPPEIDLRIGTNSSGVQTVLFQFALGSGNYTQFTMPTRFDPTQSHTYAWDWESNFITFYVDGVQQFQSANPSTAYQTAPMFLFLVTAANYIANTGDPAAASLPVSAQVTSVNIYPTKPAAVSSGSVIDATGEVWTITTTGQVAVNGVTDTTTSNVVELAYVNHAVWYETSGGVWQYKTISTGTWAPAGGTTVSPLAITESPNDTVVTTVGPVITGATGTTFAINSAGQVVINGTADTTTSGVVELAYVNHVLWQESGTSWYNYLGTPGSYGTATTTSPLTAEGIAINTIAAQLAGAGFSITGNVTNVTAAPTLQYQDNTGAWTAFPTGSTVTESSAGNALIDLGHTNIGATTTMVLHTSVASPAGALIVAVVNDSTYNLGSFTDSAGNTYTRANSCTGGAGTQGLYYVYNAQALASGASITYTALTSDYMSMSVLYVTNMNATASVLDGAICGTGTAAAAASGSLTPTVANDLFIGWASSANSGAVFTASPGFTPPPNSAIGGEGIGGYLVDSTVAAQNYVPVASISAAYGSILAAFKATVAAPASTATFLLAHPGMVTNPTNTVSVRDAGNTSAVGSSNGFAVTSATGEGLAINTVATQTANTAFTVTGTISGVAASSGGGVSSGTPPAPAAAVGYNALTFGPAIQLGLATNPTTGFPVMTGGVNWVPFAFYGNSWKSVGAVQNSDGSVTLDGTGEGYGNGLASATPPSGGSFAGQTFGKGGYFEATMKSTGPYSFWANDFESMGYSSNGGDLTERQWPGQAAGFGDWIEADMAEFDSTGVYGGAMHNWYDDNSCSGNSFSTNSLSPPGTVACGVNTLNSGSSFNQLPTNCCAGADFTAYHQFGFLWVPATSTTQGFAKWFFDRQQVGNTITWNQYNPALAPPPVDLGTGGSSAYSILDVRHLALILGGNSGATNTISAVQVWQTDGSGDLPVITTVGTGSTLPTLQYQDNAGTWQALPTGFTETNTTFSFTHPAMAANTSATISVRDANNTAVVATVTFTVTPAATGSSTGWNPADTSTSITLSNNNLTALSSTAVQGGTRAVAAQSTGKLCFDVTANAITPNLAIGISNTTFALSGTQTLGATANGVGFNPALTTALQSVYYNGVQVLRPVIRELTPTSGGTLYDNSGNAFTLTSGGVMNENGTAVPSGNGTGAIVIVGGIIYAQDSASGTWYTYSTATQTFTVSAAPTLPTASIADLSGDTITSCYDLTAQLEWVSTPAMRTASGITWNSSATASPATGVGGVSFSGLTCPCFPTATTSNVSTSVTLNTTGPLAITLPTGFSIWQPVTVIKHHPFLFNFGQRAPVNDNSEWVPARFERLAH